jgi:hypothetical protein
MPNKFISVANFDTPQHDYDTATKVFVTVLKMDYDNDGGNLRDFTTTVGL